MKAIALLSLFLLFVNWAEAAPPKFRPRKTLLSVRGGANAINRQDALLLTTDRGGGIAEATANIDKSGTWSLSDLGAKDYSYVAIHVGFLAAVVALCRSMTRSGSRAPTWITDWVPEPYATGVLHLSFFGLGLLGRSILPEGLATMVFSPPSVALLGTVFPAIESVRAAVTDGGNDDRTMLMYWVVHGIFQYSTEFMDQLALKSQFVYKYWHTFEVLAVIWLILPLTDGATLIYNTIAEPYLLPLVMPIKKYCDGWIGKNCSAVIVIHTSYLGVLTC